MTAEHTFHTPSFGDEEFEILAAPNFNEINSDCDLSPPNTSILRTTNRTNHWHVQDSSDHSNSSNVESSNFINDGNELTTTTDISEKIELDGIQKPVSSYALYFRDIQTAIKQQNPNASFEDISKIVKSMWEALDQKHKNVYRAKSELAKKKYFKLLAANKSKNALEAQEKHIQTSSNVNIKINETQHQNDGQHISPDVKTKQLGDISTHSEIIPTSKLNEKDNSTPSTIGTDTNEENRKCIRDGCNNKPVFNIDWEDEYCSSECVIIHCRDVFTKWIKENRDLLAQAQNTI